MIRTIRSTAIATLIAGALCLPSFAGDKSAGFVDLGKFVPPSDGGQFIEVNVQSALIALAAKLAEKQEPEIADLLRGLHSVRVNVIGVDSGNRNDLVDRITNLRSELETRGWEKLVTVQEKGEDIGVYLLHRGEESIEGVVVTMMDGKKEAVFVNVVGDIRPEKIAVLGERFDIKPLKKLTGPFKKS